MSIQNVPDLMRLYKAEFGDDWKTYWFQTVKVGLRDNGDGMLTTDNKFTPGQQRLWDLLPNERPFDWAEALEVAEGKKSTLSRFLEFALDHGYLRRDGRLYNKIQARA